MKKVLPLLAVVCFLTACSPRVELPDIKPTPTPTPRPPVEKPADYSEYDIVSRLDGSTATIPLSEEILIELFGIAEGLTHNRTHDAYVNLIYDKSDLIFVTYPSEEEFNMAEEAGVELEIIPVVKDALVFLGNTANSVKNLTQRQIRDIYTGKVTNWNEVGGADESITAFQRPVNSGSQTLFLKLAMDGLTPADPPLALRPAGMGDLIDAVANYDNAHNALGYSVFYYVSDMYGSPYINLLAVDGVTPTRDTIMAGTYPYITYYYAVMRKDTPEGHPARDLVNWLLTDGGQAVAQRAGYVPMRLINQRLDESGYGFYGSTPENTSQSSGTGGTQPVTSDIFSTEWRNSYNDIDLSGDPEIERIVNAWVEQTIESLGTYDHHSVIYMYESSLLSVTIRPYNEMQDENHISRMECAVFDLNRGVRIQLSDLFYNGVNYIEYINANLLTGNVGANMFYFPEDETFESYFIKRPFTGIPNDYTNFYVTSYGTEGPVLRIAIEEGNPFFESDADFLLGVRLPADLSPYGLLHALNYDRVVANDDLEMLIPRVQTETKPSQVDSVINAKIRALAETAIERYETQLMEEVAYVAGGKAKYTPSISFWNDNLTVGYSRFLWSEVSIPQGITLTVNLRTGETVDAAAYVRDDWYNGEFSAMDTHEDGSWIFLNSYSPPEGYTLDDVYILQGVTTFTVIEPDGKQIYIISYR